MGDKHIGWARHYFDDPFMDMYFNHPYHFYYHGRSLCKRSIDRMPDQPHYSETPEDVKEVGVCMWCRMQILRGVTTLPEYLWEDWAIFKYAGKTYKVLDRSKRKEE